MNLQKHSLFTIGLLAVISLTFAFPFFWMVLSTSKETQEIFTPFPLLPKNFHLTYYRELLGGQWIPFIRQYFNSLLIASTQTLGALCLAIPTGFVFSQYRFKGRTLLFITTLLVILLPRQLMVLPLLDWMKVLHLIDNPLAVILPGIMTGIGILYFIQVYKRFPSQILDLARTEGASEYKLFWLSLSLVKPAILSYTLIHFIFAWHEYLLPLAFLYSPEKLTVSLGLSSLYGHSMRMPYALLMVGSTFIVLPTALLYILLRKHFKSSLSDLVSE